MFINSSNLVSDKECLENIFILQIGRTTLLPGILKTICNNKSMPLPLKLFEISDVMYCDKSKGMSEDQVQHLQSNFEVSNVRY